jgi:hypothetical protein
MSLLASALREVGGSMLELNAIEEQSEESAKFKESKGLLRRAFSSKKRRRKSGGPRGEKVSPSESCACICYGGVHIGELYTDYTRWVSGPRFTLL